MRMENNSSTWAHAQTNKIYISEHHTPHKIESWSQYTEHLKHYQLAPSCTGYCCMVHMHARVRAHTNTHTHIHRAKPQYSATLTLWPRKSVNRNSLLYSIAIYHHPHHTATNTGEQITVAMYCDLTVNKYKLKNSKRKSHCEIYVVAHRFSDILCLVPYKCFHLHGGKIMIKGS
jgi:hypothetical protein